MGSDAQGSAAGVSITTTTKCKNENKELDTTPHGGAVSG